MGKYDIVHLRFFMTIANDENVHVVIENLKGMLSSLKPVAFDLRKGAEANFS